MPHYTDHPDFEPTPNSLLARAASQNAGGGGGGPPQRSISGAGVDAELRRNGSSSKRGDGLRHGQGRSRRGRGQSGGGVSSEVRYQAGAEEGQQSSQRYSDARYHDQQHQQSNRYSQQFGQSQGYGPGQTQDLPFKSAQTQRGSSYYDPHSPGQEQGQNDAFDVRADFDGDGPRWSEVYGVSAGAGGSKFDSGSKYEPLPDRNPQAPQLQKSHSEREELVSVPVLGPEWQKSELHELSRRGRAEVRAEKREKKYKAFLRDQTGLCGVKWLTRRNLVIGLFVLCIAVALTLFFTLPRPPSYSFYEPSPFTVDNSTIQFSRVPANFSFNGNLNLYADTSTSYLPLHLSTLSVSLYHLTTSKLIASGSYSPGTIPKGKQVPLVVPVQFTYSAINTSDTTWSDWYNSCGHMWPGTPTRPELRLRLVLDSGVRGLVTKPETGTQIGGVGCPFQLPSDGV